MHTTPRICIIALKAYGALCGNPSGHIGGAEWQTSLMAKWLAERGYPTSLICLDEGQPDGELVNGVRVWKSYQADQGLPGFRFLFPRLFGLYSAMRRADANIYYHNSAEYVTGLAAAWCRWHGRKLAYSAAAELACDARLPLLAKAYERSLYRYGVKRAHLRIVQTQRQRDLFLEGWNLEAIILPMPCPGPAPTNFQPPQPPAVPRVIWVGRVDTNKRLDWLLDIAERLPKVKFEVATAINNRGEFAKGLYHRAQGLANVRWLGPVSREKMPDLYQQATCLCCTSMHEGFPNTFLEAWSHGIPVVSTFDPDGLIKRLNLGRHATDVDALVAGISDLVADANTWTLKSRNARCYYEDNHQVGVALSRFEKAFNNLCSFGDSGHPLAQECAPLREKLGNQ